MTASDPFLQRHVPRLDELVHRASGPGSEPGLLVALSGGPDSTALLLTAVAWRGRTGRPVAALHLNHGLRGAESDGDEAFCRDLCARHDVPLTVRRVATTETAAARGAGLEEAARHLRLQAITAVLDGSAELTACALGHQRDDQLETILLRLFRGTGLDGLAVMRPVIGRLVRPLLETDRREILAFLRRQEQPWRDDSTNADGQNRRSRVRHELVPLAEAIFGPAAREAPLRLARLAAAESDTLHRLAAQALERLAAGRDDGLLPAAGLTALPAPLARRVVMLALAYAAQGAGIGAPLLEERHWRRLLAWLPRSRSGSAIDLCGGWRAARAFDGIALLPPEPPHAPAVRLALTVAPTDGEPVVDPIQHGCPPRPLPYRLTVPEDALRGDPHLRRWEAGDRLVPVAGRHPVLVGDLLQERRIPWFRREGVLVVADRGGVLWVVGLAAAARTRILPGERRNVTLRLDPV